MPCFRLENNCMCSSCSKASFAFRLVRALPGPHWAVRSKRILDMNKTEVLFEMMWHFHINWNKNIVLPLICLCETEPSSERYCDVWCCAAEGLSQSASWWLDGQTSEIPLNTAVNNMQRDLRQHTRPTQWNTNQHAVLKVMCVSVLMVNMQHRGQIRGLMDEDKPLTVGEH